mmetsp:Transcript_45753/g.122623  ORF Transcript_45753/g.122623 Transcript_45753/m.122623 type:complete len:263 (-) Transcript_45753:1801-2589(-)
MADGEAPREMACACPADPPPPLRGAHLPQSGSAGDGLETGGLPQAAVDEVGHSLDRRVVEDQSGWHLDTVELLLEVVLELHGGQTVQAGVHERRVPVQLVHAHEAEGHIRDRRDEVLDRWSLVLRHSTGLAGRCLIATLILEGGPAAAAALHKSEQLVGDVLALFLTELLLEDLKSPCCRLHGLIVLPGHDVHLSGEDLDVCLGAQILHPLRHGQGLLDDLRRIGGPPGDNIDLSDAEQCRHNGLLDAHPPRHRQSLLGGLQ